MVRNLAIIPARSGSKRVKDKNIRPFQGRPLMAWAINLALESGMFDRVYVSTDSEAYAEVARSCGAWVPFLRDEYLDDRASLSDVTFHELVRIERELGVSYDEVSVLQPTCPLLRVENVRDVYAEFASRGADSAMTCFPFAHCNPWWAFRRMPSGRADYVLSTAFDTRSQDREQLYCPTGAFAIAKADVFKTDPDGVMRRCIFVPIPWENGFDIDTESDFAMAKVLYSTLEGRNA